MSASMGSETADFRGESSTQLKSNRSYSSNIKERKILERKKVRRRRKLYYLRNRRNDLPAWVILFLLSMADGRQCPAFLSSARREPKSVKKNVCDMRLTPSIMHEEL